MQEVLQEWPSYATAPQPGELEPGDAVAIASGIHLVRAVVEETEGLKWTKQKKKRLGSAATVKSVDGEVAEVRAANPTARAGTAEVSHTPAVRR